ncbi:transmembrane amino acid transporter protein-domain-containing protein [Ephemerocybe angulata]|uniref:Transmembrane amino acid transporter protein-domain-containing protein n=1 Tax=Ephemerocybe angulata TaxID=980116 RepID=A0A8H6I982_9AGAR|nr:transmembrane amino acid transporter protein-domain-containing protein [Tulosesus angulatus]
MFNPKSLKKEFDEKSSQETSTLPPSFIEEDAVFGKLDSKGPNYRGLGEWGALVLMTKSNLGLGVLAIPTVFSVLGIVPGIICIVVVQSIIAYCAIIIGTFKVNHPEVYGLADAGGVFGGRIGREFLYLFYCILLVFITASALVGLSTALNAVSAHGTCTAVFIAVAAIAGFLVGSIRTLGKLSWIGWAGLVSIVSSIIILTVAVGVQDRPPFPAPQEGPWDKDMKIFGSPTFAEAMSAINAIVFSYGSTPLYFGIVSEMKEPRKYARMMVISVKFITVLYLIIGSVVYFYCGQYVASPALGSAGVLLKKICYGIAIPGLLASLTIFIHLSAKNIFVRVLAGSTHLQSNSMTHWLSWLGCTLAATVGGYIIASAIPIFGSLISLIGAIVCPIVCIIPHTIMWWHDNWRNVPSSERKRSTIIFALINVACFCIGLFLLGGGTYGAVIDLINTTSDNGPWTCADNSGSVVS